MSEHATVKIEDEEGGEIARLTVGIVELAKANPLEQWPGFYFTFPTAEDGAETVRLHGPYDTREAALEAAGTFIIEAVEAAAREVVGEQEIAA